MSISGISRQERLARNWKVTPTRSLLFLVIPQNMIASGALGDDNNVIWVRRADDEKEV